MLINIPHIGMLFNIYIYIFTLPVYKNSVVSHLLVRDREL